MSAVNSVLLFPLKSFLFIYLFFFRFIAGCMRDARLNGRYMPLDSQPRDGVSQVSIQGLSLGCSSDSCKRNQCSPPFTCVDLWRVHECRYTHKSVHTKYNCTVEHTDTRLLHIHTCHFDKNAWRHMHLSQFTRHLKPFSAF